MVLNHNTYPILNLTKDEYDKIPKAKELPRGFLETSELGLRFKCIGGTTIEDTVIGEIVQGKEAISEQLGASALHMPLRFVNRYRVKITD